MSSIEQGTIVLPTTDLSTLDPIKGMNHRANASIRHPLIPFRYRHGQDPASQALDSDRASSIVVKRYRDSYRANTESLHALAFSI